MSQEADLSDRTLKALDERAARLRKLKVKPPATRTFRSDASALQSMPDGKEERNLVQAERKRQAGALLETLKELCAALEIRPDSVEQRSCIRLMESAACVHITSLEKACTQAP